MTLFSALLLTLNLTAQSAPLADLPQSNRTPVLVRQTPAADVALVCPNAFQEAIAPWIAFREEQGHQIAKIDSSQSPEAIRAQIRHLANSGELRHVLLVGDSDPQAWSLPAIRAVSVPTHYVQAKVNVKWGSETLLSTDNWYADLDDDNRPDLALGRLTADTPDELSLIVRKIIAYEKMAGYGVWRRKVNFVAGVGGFGKLADAVLESSTRTLISGGLPAGYDSTMTYASWQSPYCPHPRSFHDATVARLNEGCLFWVYIGHGHYRTLDYLRGPDGDHRILTADDIAQLRCETGQPIAFFMACYTGAFDAAQDCLAEEMLRTPGGPVAVFSGSRVTMPYAMAVLGTELIHQCFERKVETLGEAIMHAKRAMLTASIEDVKKASEQGNLATNSKLVKSSTEDLTNTRRTLDMLASVISPAPDELEAERREHVQMFNLFGDPLLRLQHGTTVNVQVSAGATAGEPLRIQGHAPLAGRCLVELVATRGLLTYQPDVREKYSASQEAIRSLNDDYQRANDRRWVAQVLDVQPGPFDFTVDVPQQAAGKGHVCVFIEGTQNFALGSADLTIQRAKPER